MGFEREKVLEREGRPARFLGMSLKEMFVLLGILMATNILSGDRMVVVGAAGLYIGWIKKVRDFVPERYFTRMFRFYWMPHHVFRAGVRCSEWRDPIRSDSPS